MAGLGQLAGRHRGPDRLDADGDGSVTREEVAAGRHTLTWNGHDRDGRPLPSGQYLARLRVDGNTGTVTVLEV